MISPQAGDTVAEIALEVGGKVGKWKGVQNIIYLGKLMGFNGTLWWFNGI